MIKVLVFGSSGMLGHKMLQIMNDNFDAYGTIRGNKKDVILNKYNIIENIDVEDFKTVEKSIVDVDPDFVINCIGIIKQLKEANDPIKSHTLNSMFPHQLATYCESFGMKMIHISSDCVFDGKKGMYKETDVPNATDIYGRTKFTGEIGYPHFTLRTSIIGREIKTSNGLMEWFLSQKNKTIQGYKNAIFSGVTTNELSKIVSIIIKRCNLKGLYHVAADPISKYDLLTLLNQKFDNNTTIQEFYGEINDRSLNGWKLKKEMDYVIPSWNNMIDEVLTDDTDYRRV